MQRLLEMTSMQLSAREGMNGPFYCFGLAFSLGGSYEPVWKVGVGISKEPSESSGYGMSGIFCSSWMSLSI